MSGAARCATQQPGLSTFPNTRCPALVALQSLATPWGELSESSTIHSFGCKAKSA